MAEDTDHDIPALDRDLEKHPRRNDSDENGRPSDHEEHESIHSEKRVSGSSTPRHSYEYARSPLPSRNPSRPQTLRHATSAHDSMVTTLSRLRSRNVAAARDPFSHPLTHQKTGQDVVVDFDGKADPYRPINWPFRQKVTTTALYGFTTFGITFASSVYSAGVNEIMDEFNVGLEVSTLGISLMLLGFGLGPLLWAPLSELYGRKTAVLTPYFVAAIFSFATGAAKDIQTVMITRFFAGFFGSAPITNTGGVLGDIWSAEERGLAIVGYAIAVIGGPTLGPLVGGVIVRSHLGWRWTEYVTGILMMLFLTLDVLLLDETFPPVLLQYKARRLRHESGNWALHAKHEEWDPSIRELGKRYMIRPFQMLATPICFLVAVYAAFVYGILYANLSAFPIEFQQIRGWGQVTGALPFLALLVGIFVGAVANILNNRYYFTRFRANNNRAVPEARLPPMMIGSIFFAGGLFLFGWTSDPRISYWPSLIGIGMTGLGFFTIFQAALNYLVDTFTRYGASAIAANTFLRSCFAAAFPLFLNPMYNGIGVGWGSTVFGCVAVLAIPVPFLFFFYGRSIRARGEWSRESL